MRILRRSGTRYPVIDGKASVELKLRTPRQLFDERDPAPFRERDLDDDAAQYILTSFREIEDQRRVKLSLYFETLEEFADNPKVVCEAIRAHFAFQAQVKRRELKDIFRHGWISLLIGLVFLFICSYMGHGGSQKPADLLGSMRYEAFFIMAWVSMWKPISVFLYEWWPISESLAVLNRLSQLEVEITSREEFARPTGTVRAKDARPELRSDVKASPKKDIWTEMKVPTTA